MRLLYNDPSERYSFSFFAVERINPEERAKVGNYFKCYYFHIIFLAARLPTNLLKAPLEASH